LKTIIAKYVGTFGDVEEHPERLVQQGLSFLSGLARTLSSPEATQKLVDSIVEEDKADYTPDSCA